MAPSLTAQLLAEPHELAGDPPPFPPRGPQRRLGAATGAGSPLGPPGSATCGWKQLKPLVARENVPQPPRSAGGPGNPPPPPQGHLSSSLGHPGVLQPSSPHPGDPQPRCCAGTCLASLWRGGDAGPPCLAWAPGEQDLAITGVSVGLNSPQLGELPPRLPLPRLERGSPPWPPPPLFFSPLKGKNGAGDNG